MSNQTSTASEGLQGMLRIWHILGTKERPGLLPISKASWYAGIADGRYPRPVQIGKRAVAWNSSEINALINSLCKNKEGQR